MHNRLLQPIEIGPRTLRNRIFISAHVPGFADQGTPGKRYISYHRQRAAAGVAMQITGGTAVHRSGLLTIAPSALVNLDDTIVPGYQSLSDAVQGEGGTILAQLAHSAGTLSAELLGQPSWAPSPVRSALTGNVPHEMSSAEISEIIGAFVAASSRVRAGGLDGIELLSAFGFLPHAFLSPLNNRRTDGYGGSLRNRMRFLLELVEACRAAIGKDRILGIRIPGSDMVPGGLEISDMQTVAQALENTGQVDYLNVIAYNNSLRFGRALHWPATPARHELFTELSSQIKAVVSLPVLVAGRITHPDQAEAVIANGQADMVAMTRAHITDPEIVRKITEGRADDIRPCVGANTCIRARFQGRPVRCMHNPYVISRNTDQTPSSSNNLPLVTVVGAGPAGLEAALTAAQRGHSVRLLERSGDYGGQLRLWSRVESQKELAAIIDWRVRQLDKLGVRPEFNQTVTADQLLNIDDGIIVMATGAEAVTDTIPGDGSVAQTTPVELLNDPSLFTGRALIRDQGRGLSALCAAEALAARGSNVIVVTDEPAVGLDLDLTVRVPAYDRLLNCGVEFLPNHTLAAFEQGAVKLQHVFTGQETILASIDVLVDDHIMRPCDELIKALAGSGRVVRSVGDCIAPRTVEAAIHEAAQAITQLTQA